MLLMTVEAWAEIQSGAGMPVCDDFRPEGREQNCAENGNKIVQTNGAAGHCPIIPLFFDIIGLMSN